MKDNNRQYFKDFDFTGFWDDNDYALKEYVSDTPSDELILEIEKELGYKLPASYIYLMKQHNGGIPNNICFPTKTPTSWADDHIAISGIFGIGREKTYSLCGELGSQFMIDEWGYPSIGIAICDTPSAGHDMVFLDYSKCGADGEPAVVYIDQENDYKITFLAENFEEFIKGLINEDEFDYDENSDEDLNTVLNKPLANMLMSMCKKCGDADVFNQWIRDTAYSITKDKGFFALHDDLNSYLLYDIQFYLFINSFGAAAREEFLKQYPKIIALASGFSTNGYSESFVTDYLDLRIKSGYIEVINNKLHISNQFKKYMEKSYKTVENLLPEDLAKRIDYWYEQDRHRQIVEAVLLRDEDEQTDYILGQLAVAYNNLNEYDNAIEVLEALRYTQDNTPKFHYRLGYAYFYKSLDEKEEGKQLELIIKAREAFTRALMLNPDREIESDCRYFLGELVKLYKGTDDFKKDVEKQNNSSNEVKIYSEEEMQAVESHIEKYFGKFENIFHEIISLDVHIDICIIPPSEERKYYTLVTMGMGSYKMNVPEEMKNDNIDRAELLITLPAGWEIGSSDEKWYWPFRLLKMLAHLPHETYSWLGWGHSIDYQEPYAENTALCSSILVDPQVSDEDCDTCTLPDGSIVNFYQVIPLYKNELLYKINYGADALFDKMGDVSFIIDVDRESVISDEEIEYNESIMDIVQPHIACIHEKNLEIDDINAYNHMAIYLRWCIEHDLMSQHFNEKYADIIKQVKNNPENTDIRPFIYQELQMCLLNTYFNEEGKAFAEYYYGAREYPYYPSDIDDYSLNYFGAERYHSDEFQDEAYLFIPYDENYYQGMAAVITRRFENWHNQMILNDEEPDDTAKSLMEFLDCPCEYFPPMNDDDPVTSAYSYLSRLGVREGYIPVIICVNDVLLETLIENTESESESDTPFDIEKVRQYRKDYLSKTLLNAEEIFNISDIKTNKVQADNSEIESNNRFYSFWNQETKMTNPVIIAKVPVKNPWEIFAYIPCGSWNECPDTLILMSISKYYYDKFKAVPALISHDTLEFLLPAPVQEESVIKTALEHYFFCPDIEQNGESIEKYENMLLNSIVWFFWWD